MSKEKGMASGSHIKDVPKKQCAREGCSKKFKPRQDHQKFCSPYCGNKVRSARYWRNQLSIPETP